MNRSEFLRLLGGALAAGASAATVRSAPADAPLTRPTTRMHTRRIPASGEALPVIGCGTYIGFDVAPGSPEHARLPAVLSALFEAGGSVIDSSPMYGRAEATTGELLAAKAAPRAFLATKVWTSGRESGLRQMEESMRRLRVDTLDLMQIHNLLDWRTHLKTLHDWKARGRIRYLGVTHYTASAYRELEAVMRAEKLDFLQINYSLDEREAEQRILPLAAERGMAVIVNRPFGGGGLLRRLSGQALPPWAADIGAQTWAQLLLKFVLSQPAVTCAIPGSSRPEHMTDNAAAGMGEIPTPDFWRRHAELLRT